MKAQSIMTVQSLAVGAVLALAVPAHAAIYTVGAAGTPGTCTHQSIQQAVNTAGVNPGKDEIRVSNTQTYGGQVILVEDQELEITGGFANCFPLVPIGRTTLSGVGASAIRTQGVSSPVIRTQGTVTLTLRGLEIRDGFSDAYGGGLLHGAAGRVTITETGIRHNEAQYGGGIAVFGPPVALRELHIGAGVEIGGLSLLEGNTARYGGGILIEAGSLLIAGHNTSVRGNHATTTGGGISLFYGGSADIGSGGIGDDGIVARNIADSQGGAVSALGTANVRLYTTDPTRPVRLNHNIAQYGGALMLRAGARVSMWEGQIDHNEAQMGGGVVALYDGGELALRRDLSLGNPPAAAVACTPTLRCNLIVDNSALFGAALARIFTNVTEFAALVEIESAILRRNRGANLFDLNCFPGAGLCGQRIALRGCEISANAANNLVNTSTRPEVSLDQCTIAGNPAVTDALFRGEMLLALERSILWEPTRDLVDPIGDGTLSANHLLVSNATDFPPSVDIRSDDPRFVDPASGDFRLLGASPALDSGPATNPVAVSLDGLARVVDLPEASNFLGGSVDLGAYERALDADHLFRNGFENSGPDSDNRGLHSAL